MNRDRSAENNRAIEAAANPDIKERFLSEEKAHILRLAAVILKHRITDSDDEWSIALIATSDALDNYTMEKGDFWAYAAVVVRNRLYDYLRKQKRIGDHETGVAPEAFTGDIGEDSETNAAALSVAAMSSDTVVDSDLKQELIALNDELSTYGVSYSDLAECSPKSEKTRRDCGLAVAAIFLPPPLIDMIRQKKRLPLSDIEKRSKVKRKLLDRHRKHIIAAAIVFSEDYPILREYFPYSI